MKTKNKPARCIRINPKNGAKKLYRSAYAAAKEMNLDPVVVANACAKRCNMRNYGGYEWEYTDYAKSKMRIPGPFAGKHHTAETRERMSRAKDAKKVRVTALRDNGTTFATYESIMAAARALGTRHTSVRKALAGTQKTHRGFKWVKAQ